MQTWKNLTRFLRHLGEADPSPGAAVVAGVRPSLQGFCGRCGNGQRDGNRPESPHHDVPNRERKQGDRGSARL